MKFYFCEGCGKRITDTDLTKGEGRDKKLKGVFCKACAQGVMTMETLPMDEEQARAVLDKSLEPDPSVTPLIQTPSAPARLSRRSSASMIPAARRREPAPREPRAGHAPPARRNTAFVATAGIALLVAGATIILLNRSRRPAESAQGKPAPEQRAALSQAGAAPAPVNREAPAAPTQAVAIPRAEPAPEPHHPEAESPGAPGPSAPAEQEAESVASPPHVILARVDDPAKSVAEKIALIEDALSALPNARYSDALRQRLQELKAGEAPQPQPEVPVAQASRPGAVDAAERALAANMSLFLEAVRTSNIAEARRLGTVLLETIDLARQSAMASLVKNALHYLTLRRNARIEALNRLQGQEIRLETVQGALRGKILEVGGISIKFLPHSETDGTSRAAQYRMIPFLELTEAGWETLEVKAPEGAEADWDMVLKALAGECSPEARAKLVNEKTKSIQPLLGLVELAQTLVAGPAEPPPAVNPNAERILLVDFGGANDRHRFGLAGWNQVFREQYSELTAAGPGGVCMPAGTNPSNAYQGVKGPPRKFSAGDRIEVTWHNGSTATQLLRPRLTFTVEKRIYSELTGEGGWQRMTSVTIEPGQSGVTTFVLDAKIEGEYGLVNVGFLPQESTGLLCDKIELVTAGGASVSSASVSSAPVDSARGQRILLVDFGGSNDRHRFGLEGWSEVFMDRYSTPCDLGPAGIRISTGNNGAFSHQGLKGSARRFAPGGKIVVIWYNHGKKAVTMTPRLSMSFGGRLIPDNANNELKWFEMSAVTVPPEASADSCYEFTKETKGTYELVNVGYVPNNEGTLVCDKIEWLPPDAVEEKEAATGGPEPTATPQPGPAPEPRAVPAPAAAALTYPELPWGGIAPGWAGETFTLGVGGRRENTALGSAKLVQLPYAWNNVRGAQLKLMKPDPRNPGAADGVLVTDDRSPEPSFDLDEASWRPARLWVACDFHLDEQTAGSASLFVSPEADKMDPQKAAYLLHRNAEWKNMPAGWHRMAMCVDLKQKKYVIWINGEIKKEREYPGDKVVRVGVIFRSVTKGTWAADNFQIRIEKE
ncbi:MAG: hypothetical protein M5U26_28740 [Planctomycetota bacterium]|nr:hypothetical protein [Planctomycetota bacterium]